MKRKIFNLALITTVLLATLTQKSTAQATGQDSQNVWRFGLGLETGLPTGEIHHFSKFSLGGTARLQYDVKGRVSFMLTSGYTHFFMHDYTVGAKTSPGGSDYGLIPIKAGAKLFFVPHLYVSGEMGFAFETSKRLGDYGDKNRWLLQSAGIGYAESRSGLDVSLHYDQYSKSGYQHFGTVSLRVAYGFKL